MEFIQKQVEEFNIGKRHLANMMGEDPENFTQEDIDVRHIVCVSLHISQYFYLSVFNVSTGFFCLQFERQVAPV